MVSSVGKMNPKNHLIAHIDETMNENVMECLGTMLNTVVFWSQFIIIKLLFSYFLLIINHFHGP